MKSDPGIWTRLQATVLPPVDRESLNSIAGIMQRRQLVKARIKALNAAINAHDTQSRLALDERERRNELAVERDTLVGLLDSLNQRYDELDAHRNSRFSRSLIAVLRRDFPEAVVEGWIARANADMDARQERAKRALVGSAIPVLGAAGSPRERKS